MLSFAQLTQEIARLRFGCSTRRRITASGIVEITMRLPGEEEEPKGDRRSA